MSEQVQPGWYYAQGDPEGTHRYWDGANWQGGPVPAQGPGPMQNAVDTPYGVGGQPMYGGLRRPVATIGARFGAYLIDGIAGFVSAIPFIIGVLIARSGRAATGFILFIIGLLILMGFGFWNHVIRQGRTGQTIGKSQMNVTLLDNKTLQPVGVGTAFARSLIGEFVDSILAIGYIMALVDENNQRLGDRIFDINVYQA